MKHPLLLTLAMAVTGCIGETITEAPGETTVTTSTFDNTATVTLIDALVKRRRYMESQRDNTTLSQSRRDEMAQLIEIEDAMLDKYLSQLLNHGVLLKIEFDLTLPEEPAAAMNTAPLADTPRPGIVTPSRELSSYEGTTRPGGGE
jgi:hypothetical protein